MNPKDKPETATSTESQPIEGPAGLDLHPKPPKAVRLSKLAGLAFVVVGLGLLVAFAYGGYKRQQRDQVAASEAGLPRSVAPATTAGNEFVQAIPVKDPPLPQKSGANQLQPPGTYTGATPPIGQAAADVASCGWDPRTGQPYRFNPQTGQPCMVPPQQDRVVVRQAPPAQYAAAPPQPSAEEQRLAAAYQREREAMAAPTWNSLGEWHYGSLIPIRGNEPFSRLVTTLSIEAGTRNAEC